MTSRVRVAAGIPQAWTTGGIDRPRIRRFLERAEALGFESAWVVEQVLGTLPCLEPVQLLSWAAALTSRIRLGTAVLLTPLRSPVHLAKSLATWAFYAVGALGISSPGAASTSGSAWAGTRRSTRPSASPRRAAWRASTRGSV